MASHSEVIGTPEGSVLVDVLLGRVRTVPFLKELAWQSGYRLEAVLVLY